MARIVLISCVKKKLRCKSKARDLYISPLFRKSLEYAKSLNPDRIFILSAKHYLLGLNKEIAPYNKTLNEMDSQKRKKWADSVLKQLKRANS